MSNHIDINHIAKLARLRITESERESFEREMEAIVGMVDHLPDIDGDVVLDPKNVMSLREDEISGERFARDMLLANAPSVQAGCLVVPKTVE